MSTNDKLALSIDRLYHGYTPRSKHKNKEDIDEKTALVTELTEDTVRWMKSRRHPRTTCPVPISRYREKQLRDMFDGLDFEKKGYIDLPVLKDVIRYIEANSVKKERRTHPSYQQNEISMKEVEKVFDNMDIDGDGKVDYQEFTHAMAGT
jgi:hypothetical protein